MFALGTQIGIGMGVSTEPSGFSLVGETHCLPHYTEAYCRLICHTKAEKEFRKGSMKLLPL